MEGNAFIRGVRLGISRRCDSERVDRSSSGSVAEELS